MTPPDLLNLAAGAATLGLAALSAGMGCGLQTRAARYITAFFACFALANLFGTFLLGGDAWLTTAAVRWLRVIEVPLVYLLGPLLYDYARAVTRPGHTPTRARLRWHLLPAGMAFVVSLANAVAPFDTAAAGETVFLLSFHAWLLQGTPYLLAALWHAFHPHLPQEHDAARQLGWLRGLLAVIVACWISSTLGRWAPAADIPGWPWLGVALNWLTTAGMYVLALSGLRQRILMARPPAAGTTDARDATATGTAMDPRYQRSGLDASHCARIAAELTRLVQAERLYADPDFDLLRLSQRSGWPPNHVSQALNQGLGQNFFEFVNTFRIASATASLADGGDGRSVLEIALASGFGSKSTFNAVFKRMTGHTPREYRRLPATDKQAGSCP